MKIYLDKRGFDKKHVDDLLKEHPGLFTLTLDRDIDIAFCYANILRKENLQNLPNLKWVQLLSAGYDGADIDEMKKRKLVVTNAKGVFSITIAEDIVTKILVLNRAVKEYIRQMDKGEWLPHRYESEIFGSTIGFLGAGSIATEAAKRLKAFEAKLICYRHSPKKDPAFDEAYTGPEGLKHVLQVSNVIVIALPLTKDTANIINKDTISLMKKTAIIVNVGRGGLINQDDLIEALKSNRIKGAALDVATPEPLPSTSPLWHMDNVYITPHDSTSSPYKFDRLERLVLDNLYVYTANESLDNVIFDFRKA